VELRLRMKIEDSLDTHPVTSAHLEVTRERFGDNEEDGGDELERREERFGHPIGIGREFVLILNFRILIFSMRH